MQTYYRKHQGKNPKSIIIKIARKLLNRMLSVIKGNTLSKKTIQRNKADYKTPQVIPPKKKVTKGKPVAAF
ncbi:MAG: hypothetical protein IPF75_15245 [Bacteroidetes bacterium]|nr:hypothetical protein [Bacteroidota bacterium]